MSLSSLLAQAEPLEGGFRVAVPGDWHQGRTAYGGLSAALALVAAQRIGGDLPPLRSAQVSFVGPLYGAIEARARVLRQGKNATWVSAELLREGEAGLVASFVFMGPVDSSLHLNHCPPPEGLIPVDEAVPLLPREHTPVFLRNHYEVRFALPRTGPSSEKKRPEVCWWVRPTGHEGLDPAVAPLLSADAVPPAVLPFMRPGVAVSTMTWQINMLTPAPATRDGWWLLRSIGDHAGQGCSSEQMQLWNADGEPVMAAMQSIGLFG